MEIKHPTSHLSHIILKHSEFDSVVNYFRKNKGNIPHFQTSDARLISDDIITLYVYKDDIDKWMTILNESGVVV